MKTIEILGKDREKSYSKVCEGCRGILIRGGKILLSYTKKNDMYLIPGGGVEVGETLGECCERELREEAGLTVNAHTHYLTLEEYYHKFYFKSHYFLCGYIGECQSSLTENETDAGLEPRWIDFNEALKIFASYESYRDTDEIRFGAYYREYIALTELQKL